MFWLKKKPEAVVLSIPQATKDSWVAVFSDALKWSIDDAESLARFNDPAHCRRMVSAARAIADAALNEFEDRFRG